MKPNVGEEYHPSDGEVLLWHPILHVLFNDPYF